MPDASPEATALSSATFDGTVGDMLGNDLGGVFDRAWYLQRYPDVAAAGIDPLQHYLHHGADENRDPNPLFDAAWYLEQNPDVAASRVNPVMHYFEYGAAELRNPHPRFDATYYVTEHPEAAGNPLLFHLRTGRALGWATEKIADIAAYLPSPGGAALPCPVGVTVDVVIPVYRGLEQTQRCLATVLSDSDRVAGRIIVIDDCSPEPKLSAWLDSMAEEGSITLLRNARNRGFVASANRGMQAAGSADVVLLNSDTEVPVGWLRRLAAHAYGNNRVGSVSPFSNNATICSYPTLAGGPLALGCNLAALDDACRMSNAGRAVDVPTTVGFCMYIRRDCLLDVGPFDERTFRRGYGEENDFCLRATARGWRHHLACDVFVYHEGEVSFGKNSPELTRSRSVLLRRYPTYEIDIARHVRLDPAGPFRFALTASLLRQSGRPIVLLVSHGLGGGVRRQLAHLQEAAGDAAHFLMMEGAPGGIVLSVPSLPGHPALHLADNRIDDLVRFLRSAGVTRLHLHHIMGLRLDLRRLIHQMDVPFDVTVHDYFTICPRVNLLPTMDSHYCGEPDPAGCNACIARGPAHGARDIEDWRLAHRWIFLEADRVICPSDDVRRRLARYGLADRAIVVPHEAVARSPWPVTQPSPGRGRKLRIALLGVLADQKGAPTVRSVIEAANPAAFEFHLIGHPEQPLPEDVGRRLHQTGRYEEADLAALIARTKPHLIWFPAQWPETYSYTLSAAIAAGLPVVASDIGAFTERLDGRPQSWLVPPDASATAWIAAFEQVRASLARTAPRSRPRPPVPNFYAAAYLQPPPRPRDPTGLIDLRRPGRRAVVLIPERLETGCLSPCAYIRLLQPMRHPAIGDALNVVMATAEEALHYRADAIVTHRHAIPDIAAADALHAHCSQHRIALLYDLDDDLIDPPPDHPDAARLRAQAAVVARMVDHATAVWVSTDALRQKLAASAHAVRLVANGLDERMWSPHAPAAFIPGGPLRILVMGTSTHDADFAMIEPALHRLHVAFGERVSIDVIGVTGRGTLPPGVRRMDVPGTASASYPAFVHWLSHQPRWHLGLAPLVDTPFNRAKSAIKTIDYAALGLPTLASDVGPYRDATIIREGGGQLVANTTLAWFERLSDLVRNPLLRTQLTEAAEASYRRSSTLGAQASARRAAWLDLVAPRPAAARTRRREVEKR